jgi:hypothetical protein
VGGLRVALFISRKPQSRLRPTHPQHQETQAMTDITVSTIERIRELNDDFRRTFVGGAVVITAGVEAMPAEQRRSLLAKVRAFNAFTEDNDPHGEHDFGESTRAVSVTSGRSTTTTAPPNSAPPIPLIPPSPPAY